MDRQESAQLFVDYLLQDDVAVQREVLRAGRAFSWLRILPKERKPWGRDVISVQAAAHVLNIVVQLMRKP